MLKTGLKKFVKYGIFRTAHPKESDPNQKKKINPEGKFAG